MALTERSIDSLKPRDVDYIEWDDKLSGFGVRVSPKGNKAFIFQYRNKAGRTRRMKLGRYPTFSLESAKKDFKRLSAEVAVGGDPAETRNAERAAATFGEFADQYLTDAKRRLSGSAWGTAHQRVEQILKPAWGPRKLDSITASEVARLHHRLADRTKREVTPANAKKTYKQRRGGPITANRTLATIRAMFNYAETLGAIPQGTNPARGIKMLPEKARERYLTPEELASLAEALDHAEKAGTVSPWAVGAIRLLAFTGCRKNEILSLRWEHVDAKASCLRLPDSKTGAKTVWLNSPALKLLTDLAKLKVAGNPYVITGHIEKKQLVNISKPWARICKSAGLTGLRLHDLRHVFAGTGAALGLGLTAVGKLLGHSQAETTLRYSNMAPSPLHAASEAIGAALVEAMERKGAKIVQLVPKDNSAAEAQA